MMNNIIIESILYIRSIKQIKISTNVFSILGDTVAIQLNYYDIYVVHLFHFSLFVLHLLAGFLFVL